MDALPQRPMAFCRQPIRRPTIADTCCSIEQQVSVYVTDAVSALLREIEEIGEGGLEVGARVFCFYDEPAG